MFVWSKLTSAQWADAWEERFAGNPNLVIEYLKGAKSIRLRVFCQSENEALEIKKRFGGGIRKTSAAEWNKPAELPKPVKVRDAFLLTAETRPRELAALRKANPGREIISIPAEMAFGTGDHATTSTCLRMLVDLARSADFSPPASGKWSVADLGSGTGVLAIAARKLGASEVFACDFDPFAVAAAKRNAGRNNTPDIRIEEQDVLKWKPRKNGYDLVLANLFSTILIQAWPVIARSLAPGGQLIVSGILHSQAWDVFTAAAGHGLGFSKVVRKGKWITARGGHMTDLIAGSAA
jgi:ribosomal protein L11 methyltransferase